MNPFHKYRSPTSRQNTLNNAERGEGEGENGLAKIHTDDLGPRSPGAQARREDLQGAWVPAPKQAQTLPNVSPTTNNGPEHDDDLIPRTTSPIQEEPPDKISQQIGGNQEKDSPSSQTLRDDEVRDEHSHNPMKVISEKFTNMTHRKSQQDSESDQQKDSDDKNNGKDKPKFTWQSQVRATVLNSWINVLLIACK